MSFLSLVGDAVEFLWSNPGQVLSDVRGHLVLSGSAVGLAVALAVPLGALVGHLHRGSFLAINVANTLRALPTFAIIALYLAFVGLGFDNILVALVILGLPLILTNTYVAVSEVDQDAVEAARGMGMTGWQILWRVELPNSVGLTVGGIRTATVFIIATAYLANFAGVGQTLGAVITIRSAPTYELLGYTILSVALALLADAVLAVVQRVLTPKGVKLTRVSAAA